MSVWRETMRSSGRVAPVSAGFTLVETAIVLVIVALLLGGLIGPYGVRLQQRQFDSTAERIEEAKDAIVAYAVRSRTAENTLDFGTTSYTVPSGRPYLPCPDVNGDGKEDRDIATTDVAASHAGNPGVSITDFPETLSEATAEGSGACQSPTGLLPWRTLGVPATDPWGNYFSYFVDPEYSNHLIGFDESTIADKYDSRQGLTVTVIAAATLNTPRKRDTDDNERAVIVRGLSVTLAGEVASGAVTLTTTRTDKDEPLVRTYVKGDVTDGLPVVIVSHGPDGGGGINKSSNDGVISECNGLGVAHPFEKLNAPTWDSADVTRPASCTIAAQPSATNPSGEREGYRMLPSPVKLSVAVTEDNMFDDVVGWLSADVLVGELVEERVFPVEPLPEVGP